jgi:D-glycero-D-manno-heptose 1,7-bisphosphate phosphatase
MGVYRLNKRAVFLDRDGVINRAFIKDGKPFPPQSLSELEILPGVENTLLRLKKAGLLIIVVTNQPDVARGKTQKEIVEQIHSMFLKKLPLHDIMVCYHDDSDNCQCRKPLPGMLVDAAEKYSINLKKSFMIGDRWKDVEAGQNAGCRTALIQYGYQEKKPIKPADIVVSSLSETAEWILKKTSF